MLRANLERVRAEIAGTGRDPDERPDSGGGQVRARSRSSGCWPRPGLTLLGENRAQDLVAKADAYPGVFTWDFIGHLQSRKVKQVLPYVRYIETVASDSALEQLRRHGSDATEILVEVNVAGDEGKSGIAPGELPGLLERCPVKVVGLMTMPPLADESEASRRHFAALRELAAEHDLSELSMGTSQDYIVAVEEGATIVRLGTGLYRPGQPSGAS